MKKLNKTIIVGSKVLEIFCWIGMAICIGCLIFGLFIKPDFIVEKFGRMPGYDTFVSGYIHHVEPGDVINLKGVMATYIMDSLILYCVFIMVFRNVNLIFRIAEGKSKLAKGKTPFQPESIKRIRQIGCLYICYPVLKTIIFCISHFIFHIESLEFNIHFSYVLIGIVVICLARFFDYGSELESDVEGLI